MHRIDVPSATIDNKFTEGSPSGGVPATTVSDDWLNDLQENVCEVIEAAGISLTKGRALDLLDAINALINGTGSELLAANGFREFTDDGLTLQWVSVTTSASGYTNFNFPMAFSAYYGAIPGSGDAAASPTLRTYATIGPAITSGGLVTGVRAYASDQNGAQQSVSVTIFALGKL